MPLATGHRAGRGRVSYFFLTCRVTLRVAFVCEQIVGPQSKKDACAKALPATNGLSVAATGTVTVSIWPVQLKS